ncbi:MAG: FtsW/RodA/SpoVE family cell cycle protein [Clostridia bacterium]|nr:FtsW/RodA/SpoVE family cell cycle protein [Clostridia bacterium]
MAKSRKSSEKGISLFTKGASDYLIWIVVAMLLALGLIMVLSASSATALAESGDSYKYFKKQLIAAVVGVVGMIVASKVDYRIYRRIKWPIYVVIVGLLFAVKFVGMSSRTEPKDGLGLQVLTSNHLSLQNLL